MTKTFKKRVELKAPDLGETGFLELEEMNSGTFPNDANAVINLQEPKKEVQGVGHFLEVGLGSPMGTPLMCR